MRKIFFSVPGIPVPKARPRFANGHCYTPQKTTVYEHRIAWLYKQAAGPTELIRSPVELKISAAFPMPKKATKAERDLGWRPKTTRPDMDNLVKIVCDALNGVAWADDALIWSITAQKQEIMGPAEIIVEIKW